MRALGGNGFLLYGREMLRDAINPSEKNVVFFVHTKIFFGQYSITKK